MSEEVLLSVITISFNSAETIKRNLESVSSLDTKQVEHLVIDGDSDDGTVDILRSFRSKADLKFVSEPDEGISDAFNKGVALAKGKFVHFLNSDDLYDTSEMRKVLARLRKLQAENLILCTPIFKKGLEGEELKTTPLPRPEELLTQMSVFHPGCFFSKGVLSDIGAHRLDLKVAMDYDFLLRAYLKGVKFDVLAHYPTIFQVGGISSGIKKNIIKGYCEILKTQHRLGVLSCKSLHISFDRALVLYFPRIFKHYRRFVTKAYGTLRRAYRLFRSVV